MSFSADKFPLEQAHAEASCGVIPFPAVPHAEHEQTLGFIEFPGNGLAPRSLRAFD
jgi:hypothetical protein